ncbi:MAG TPA: ABC transporter substrate-binding protein [Abditibacteriaceae bacterium]|jgi:NitT/TauT family transport system substrate-binding protein
MKQLTHWRWGLAAAALLGVVLAGCANNAAQTGSSDGGTSSATTTGTGANAKPISIGMSDWPGYLVWDIAEQQGFFKKHNVNVKLVWFPVYTDSLNAFAAGQLDGNSQTWNDFMAPLAQGVDAKTVLLFDNSAGNDALIAQPGIKTIKELKGKKVATELGTCDHFLMLKALESAGMTEKDIQFVPIAVQDCPNAMLSKRVDAAVVWEPSRTKILKEIKGSTQLFDSADIPGAIPDLLVMKSDTVQSRRAEVQNLVDAWYESIDWWRANPDKAVQIMAKRTGTSVADYQSFIMGTRILSAPEAMIAMTKSAKPVSLYSSGESVSRFLIKVEQITKMPDYAAAVDASFTEASLSKGLGKMPPYDYKLKIQ